MSSILSIVALSYAAFLVVGLVFAWYRERPFPVWALLPAGALAWVATYVLGSWVASLAGPFSPLGNQWQAVVLINAAVAVIVSAVILRDYGRPALVWLAAGLLFMGAFLSLMVVSPASFRPGSGGFATALGGLATPIEALMLVAVG